MYSTCYCCQILKKLHFSWQIFEKFIKIRPVGAELFREGGGTDGQKDGRTDRQTDRQKVGQTAGHDEANSRFLKFCENV